MSKNKLQDLMDDLSSGKISRRSFTTKTLALGLSAGAVSTLLQACGGSDNSSSGSADPSGTITVWTWPDNDKTFAKTVPIFEKKHPKIKVKVQAFGTNYGDKLLTAIVAGSGPDVAMVEIGSVARFKAKPGFVDLSQSPYSAKQYQNSYAPFSWGYVNDPKTGHIFALPKNTGPGGMFYRRDLLEKVGLPSDPDKVQGLLKDWDSFIEIGKKISVKDNRWMVSTPSEIFSTIIAQSGVSYYDQNGKSQIDNENFKTALEYTKKAWDAGIISPFAGWSAEWAGAITNGTVATYFLGNWFGGLLKSTYAKDETGKWGITYAPAYQNSISYNSGGDFIGILQTSNQKDAAWEFIKFVTQDSDSLQMMYTANDLYPAWTPSLKDAWMNASDPYYKGQQVNSVFANVQAKMQPPITNPNDPLVSNIINTTLLTDITKGNVDVATALTKAKQQINAKTVQQ